MSITKERYAEIAKMSAQLNEYGFDQISAVIEELGTELVMAEESHATILRTMEGTTVAQANHIAELTANCDKLAGLLVDEREESEARLNRIVELESEVAQWELDHAPIGLAEAIDKRLEALQTIAKRLHDALQQEQEFLGFAHQISIKYLIGQPSGYATQQAIDAYIELLDGPLQRKVQGDAKTAMQNRQDFDHADEGPDENFESDSRGNPGYVGKDI